jgi:hypothetical protein
MKSLMSLRQMSEFEIGTLVVAAFLGGLFIGSLR